MCLMLQQKLKFILQIKRLNNNVIKKIEGLVLNYDNIFNLQNKNSEISLLNVKKTLNNPSLELVEVIKKSQLFHITLMDYLILLFNPLGFIFSTFYY